MGKNFFVKGGFLIVLIALFLITTAAIEYFMPTQDSPTEPTGSSDIFYVNQDTIVQEEIYYRYCQHLKVKEYQGDPRFSNKTFEEISKGGWSVFWGEDNKVVVFKEVDQLCPDDEDKRHIALYEDQLAIFAGPVGSKGQPIEILSIDINKLEPELQEQIKNGGIDFSNQEELYEAMENFDEY